MWGYIIDGVLILIILINAIKGLIKGFLDSVLSLVSTGLALAVSVFSSKYLAGIINKIFDLENTIIKEIGGADGVFKVFGIEFKNPDIAKFCVWLITAIATFLLTKLVILILAKIFEKVAKAPVISGINRVLGLVFGIVKGGVVAVILIAIASVVTQLPVIGSKVSDKIAETKVTSFAYKYVDEFVENQLTKENIESLISKMTDKD